MKKLKYLFLFLSLVLTIISCGSKEVGLNPNDVNYEADPETLDAKGLPVHTFSAILLVMPNKKEYTIDLN